MARATRFQMPAIPESLKPLAAALAAIAAFAAIASVFVWGGSRLFHAGDVSDADAMAFNRAAFDALPELRLAIDAGSQHPAGRRFVLIQADKHRSNTLYTLLERSTGCRWEVWGESEGSGGALTPKSATPPACLSPQPAALPAHGAPAPVSGG